MSQPWLNVFASGSATGGGSGFENLAVAVREGILDAQIRAVISHHAEGGVYQRAKKLGIPFFHFPGPWTKQEYQMITQITSVDFTALSGWLKPVKGLDPKTTFNIHPAPLNDQKRKFGGKGMYGHHVHEAVLAAYKAGQITHSAVSMHFATEEYDQGPLFFHMPVEIFPDDTAQSLGKRVNIMEHYWQPQITNLVVLGHIYWDGKDLASLRVPEGYKFLPK